MKKNKLLMTTIAVALSGAGCTVYQPTPITAENMNFSELKAAENYQFPADMTTLSLAQAQELALQNNQDFKRIQFSIDSAKAKYYQSYSTYAPTVNINMSVQQTFKELYSVDNSPKTKSLSEAYTPSISGQLLIFDCLSREMNLLSNKYALKQTENTVEDAKRLLLSAVAYAYNDVLLAEAQLEIIDAEIAYSKQMLEEAEAKLKAGTTLKSDVLNFRITHENGKLSRISILYNIKSNKYILASYLGIIDGTIPDVIKLPKFKMPQDEFILDVDTYIDQAIVNRPDLQAYRNQLKAAEYSYWSSLGEFGPKIYANYSYSIDVNHKHIKGDGYNNTHSTEGSFSYGVTANWNVFNGMYDYFNTKIAKTYMAEVDYQLAQDLINVVTEVRTAYDSYKANIEKAQLSHLICDITQQNRDLVDNEYKAGTALVTRVNEAESDLISAQNNLVTALVDISNSKAQLEAAVYMFQQSNQNSNNEVN